MRTRALQFVGLLALAFSAASCTVEETEAPDVSGPSEMALSISAQAAPDLVYWDGTSQSTVTIEARGPNSQPARGVSLRVDMSVDGVQADFGTLSARTIVTGDDGRARVTYTAPPAPALLSGNGSTVTLVLTPTSGDYRGDFGRQVDIRVIPRGTIVPPNGAPVPNFTFSPTSVATFQTVFFDASTTQDEGVTCGANCSYTWTFGDGGSGSGQTAQHEFRSAGTFNVTLRVTDVLGQSAQVQKPVTVGAGTPPTAAFTFSPASPAVSQDIFFTAAASTAATGRRLVGYDWDFGSGRTGSGVTVAKRYDTPGEYNVTLTVTDDAGQQATTGEVVTVGAPGTGPTARLTISPTSPRAGAMVVFDASGSSGPSPIVEYRFTFGDSTTEIVQSTPVTTHPYPTPATFVARLTVRDSAGRTATTTVNVTVVP